MDSHFIMRLLNDAEQKRIIGGDNCPYPPCTQTGDIITRVCSTSQHLDVRQCQYLECTCSVSVTVDDNCDLNCEKNTLVSRECSYPVTPLSTHP